MILVSWTGLANLQNDWRGSYFFWWTFLIHKIYPCAKLYSARLYLGGHSPPPPPPEFGTSKKLGVLFCYKPWYCSYYYMIFLFN